MLETGNGIDTLISGINTARIEPSHLTGTSSGPDDPGDDYITNAHGERFDKAIHRADKEGNPLMTKGGRFRLKPGRKTGVDYSNAGPKLNNPFQSDEEGADETHPKVDAQLTFAANTAAEIYIQSGVLIFGGEWLPDPARMEREQLVMAFEQYFLAKGVVDIPPGVALAIALLGYAAPRFYLPQTQSRVQIAWIWLRSKFARKKDDATRAYFRSNGMRENDAGAANGAVRTSWWRTRPNS